MAVRTIWIVVLLSNCVILVLMSKTSKDRNKNEKENNVDFEQLMKALLSVPPKENKGIKEKAQKERKKKSRKNNKV